LFLQVLGLAGRSHLVGYCTPVPMALQWKEAAGKLALTSLQLVQRCGDPFKPSFWQYTVSASWKQNVDCV
jgi:hypothetical protein